MENQLEAEIAALKAMLQAKEAELAAEKARSELLLVVQHELRTPLTLILGPLEEMLSVGALPSHMRRGLRRVQRNAVRMYRLIDHLMFFVKAASGKLAARPEPVSTSEMLADVVDDVQALAQVRGVTLSVRSNDLPPAVEIDPQLLERIALNLLGNALACTHAGFIEIALGYAHDQLELRVRDTGAGIPADELDRIFEPFVQSRAGERGRGTGLGLALVKQLAELMGGRVAVTSVVGAGSTFTVWLPAPTCEPPACSAAGLEVERSRFLAALGRDDSGGRSGRASSHADEQRADKPRLLVVEDDEDMRAYLGELLAGDFEVVSAENGERAWKAIHRQFFEVVVADVRMAGMNGFELVEAMKSSPLLASIPIILVTARGASEAALGLDMGADDYVAKPFVPAELTARVRAAHRRAVVHKQLRDESHLAGMAVMANVILNDTGAVVSRLAASVSVIENQLLAPWAPASLERLVKKLCDAEDKNLDDTSDQIYLPVYLNSLAKQLAGEQRIMASELHGLKEHLGQVQRVLQAHEELARSAGITEMVAPSQLLDDALVLSADVLEQAGIIVQRSEEDMPPIGLERHRVLQILVNLLGNAEQALAYTDQEDKTIVVHARCVDHERLTISISDNGDGIPDEDLEYIFEPGIARRHAGALYASAMLATELGGRITCQSDGPGQGATFTLDVPYTPLSG